MGQVTSDVLVSSQENHPCPPKLSLELVDARLQPDKSISAGGRRYPPETYWQDGTSYFGCPCLISRCLRKCPARPEHFCVQIFPNGTIEGVLVCFLPDEGLPPKKFHLYLYPALLMISVFFLILTLITYIFTPEHNLHSRCMTVYCVCLAIGSFGLAVIQITGESFTKTSCHLVAFITYYFLLSSFYWLNVMCFDIWCTFSGFKTLTATLNQSNRKKFLIYCSYATFVPTVLFIITLSLQLTDPDIHADDAEYIQPSEELKLRPGFTINGCWFQNELATFFYFNGPVSILLIFNLFFFISTTVKSLRLKRETSMLKKDSESRTHNDDKIRFKLYFKLFLVTGLSWTFEIISGLGHLAGAPAWTWYLTDSINSLQGFFIFVLCVWFTKSRNILLQRLCCKRFADQFRVTTITPQPGASACTKSSDASESGHQESYSMKSIKSNRSQFDE
ncbi:hypothetical protein B566_EDAN004653 [Ephemera danica]|nr:hypothetical protein B566_EDAN004653 [Ephemera danica]